MRPKHWIKNLLIFAPLFFSLQINIGKLIQVGVAVIAFSLMSSSIYVINDIFDVNLDRLHPEKKKRMIASNKISVRAASLIAIVLFVVSIFISSYLDVFFRVILISYFVINLFYTKILKHIPIVDVMIIAIGFVLRILAGASAIKIDISHWIVLCTFFGALFIAFGKRKNENDLLKKNSHAHRSTLLTYTPDFINQLIGLTSVMVIMTYSLFTIDSHTIEHFGTENLIYTLPFVIFGVFRYFHILYNKYSGGDPTHIFLTDKSLISIFLMWVFSFALIVNLK